MKGHTRGCKYKKKKKKKGVGMVADFFFPFSTAVMLFQFQKEHYENMQILRVYNKSFVKQLSVQRKDKSSKP